MTLTWEPCDEPDEYGPPKPTFCVSGPQTHLWMLAIEEGRVTLHTTECRLCSDGLPEAFDHHEYEMNEIAVRVWLNVERQADDVWTWVQVTPAQPCDAAGHPYRGDARIGAELVGRCVCGTRIYPAGGPA